jgi:hypothetical protein
MAVPGTSLSPLGMPYAIRGTGGFGASYDSSAHRTSVSPAKSPLNYQLDSSRPYPESPVLYPQDGDAEGKRIKPRLPSH